MVLDNLNKDWNWLAIGRNSFENDKNMYVKQNYKKILLANIKQKIK